MSKPPNPRAVARSVTGTVLRRRFAKLGLTIGGIAVVGLLSLWGLGIIGNSKDGCGLGMSQAEARPACIEADLAKRPSP